MIILFRTRRRFGLHDQVEFPFGKISRFDRRSVAIMQLQELRSRHKHKLSTTIARHAKRLDMKI